MSSPSPFSVFDEVPPIEASSSRPPLDIPAQIQKHRALAEVRASGGIPLAELPSILSESSDKDSVETPPPTTPAAEGPAGELAVRLGLSAYYHPASAIPAPPSFTETTPPAKRRVLQPVRRDLDMADEDLRPDAPPVVGVNVGKDSSAAGTNVEIVHDAGIPLPALEDVTTSSVTINYRFNISLPRGDARVPSMDLLMERLRGVLAGDFLTNPEKAEIAHGNPEGPGAPSQLVKKIDAERARMGESGRPRLPRHGNIVSPDGGNETQFYSMADLAAQLRAPYAGVNQKYLKSCREAGLDPNDHSGIEFTYKDYKIFLTVH